MTLKRRLLVAFAAVVGIPLLVGLVVLASVLPHVVGRQQDRAVAEQARLGADVLAQLCARGAAVASAAGQAVLTAPAGAAAASTEPLPGLLTSGGVSGLEVDDGAGHVVRAGTAAGAAGLDCVSGQGRGPLLQAVVRLERPGAPTGRATAVLGSVDDLLGQVVARPSTVALTRDGRVVAATGPAADALPGLLPAAVAARGGAAHVGDAVGASSAVPGSAGLALVVVDAVAGGVDVVRTGLVVLLVALLLAAALAPLAARAATEPLDELNAAASRVAAGELDTVIPVRSKDELGRLAAAFNVMTVELRARVGELQASRDELRAGLARLGETLSSTHDADRMLAVVLDTAAATAGAEAGAVLLVQPGGDVVEVVAARGLTDRVQEPVRVRVGEGVVGRVAALGESVSGRVADLDPAPSEPTAETVLALPLRGARGILGALALYDVRAGVDLGPLQTLAEQAAVAVENVLLHRDASRLALTDGLTGLANYRSLVQTLDREVERADRYGRPLGLLLLDVDHFKQVNDTHGHQRGDEVLVELARRVTAEMRDVDAVARYGGEEIVVVLPETDIAGAEQAAERIRLAVRDQPFGSGDPRVRVTVSIGVAVHGGGSGSAKGLLRQADEALYDAKRAGRDTWRSSPAAVERPA